MGEKENVKLFAESERVRVLYLPSFYSLSSLSLLVIVGVLGFFREAGISILLMKYILGTIYGSRNTF